MLISTLFAAAIWPVTVTRDCEPNADTSVVGVAKNESGNILYCEFFNEADENSLKINYVANGKIFAEKSLRFSEYPFLPVVTQHDFRDGERRQADVSEQHVQLRYQANSHKKIDTAVIPLKNVDILDAGFDNFIRANWDDLKLGKTLSVNFASIAHLKTLPLRVRSQPLEKCSVKVEKQSSTTCIFVEIDNALLRIILGNIKLLYDDKKRLSEFNGIVNIQDDKQANQKAIIHYFYRGDYLHSNN
ncbi:MAG: hypothetical protein EOO52_12655 [Gammaproteobacteria bacterium]|nr:MAG: hypothetical protein EOO52_12655 [Gammaproteobacteria bacterium]